MKSGSKPTQTVKRTAFIAILTALCPLLAAADSRTVADPFAGAFFPPELVLLARDRIALTPEQREALEASMEKTKPRSDELRAKLERETAALSALAKQDRLNEAEIVAQLDRVLDVERELKHLHIGLLSATKNLLNPEQQAKLRELAIDGGAQLVATARKRLTEKVERVKQGAQKWATSGRDPAAIIETMQEKVKPLLDAGKVIEAEAELDRLLEQLKPDADASDGRPAVGDKSLGAKARIDPAARFSV